MSKFIDSFMQRGVARMLLLGVASATAAVIIVTALPDVLSGRITSVSVDMRVSSGESATLRLNGDAENDVTVPITAGRHTYSFEDLDGDTIRSVRLELSGVQWSRIDLFDMAFLEGGSVVETIDARELGVWFTSPDVIIEPSTPSRFSMTALAPVISGSSSEPLLVGEPAFLSGPLDAFLDLEQTTAIACLAGALVVVGLAARARRRLLLGGLVLVIVAIVLVAFEVVPSVIDPIPSTDTAVGVAAFFSRPYRGGQAASLVALALASIAAVVVGILARRVPREAPDADEADSDASPSSDRIRRPWAFGPLSWRKVGMLVGCAVVVAAVLALLPDLEQNLVRATQRRFVPSWDGDNLLAWRYFDSIGLEPMRDFWYPYGEQWRADDVSGAFSSSLVSGQLLFFTVQVLTLVGLFRAVWILARRHLGPPLCLVGAVVVLGHVVLGDLWRYIVPIVVALLFAAIDHRRGRFGIDHLVFGIACTLALFLEPTFLLYAAAGVLAVLVIDAVLDRPSSWKRFGVELVRSFAIPAAGVVVYVLSLIARDTIDATSDWTLRLADVSAYSASVYPDGSWGLDDVLSYAVIVTVAPFIAIGIGVFLRFTKSTTSRGAADYLVAVGAVSFLIVQKNLIRPFPAGLGLVPLLPAIGAIALLAARRWSSARAIAVGGFTGLMVSVAIIPGLISELAGSISEVPERAWSNASIVLRHRDAIDHAERERFALGRFADYPLELAAVSKLRSIAPHGRAYVLSATPAFYILLGEDDPPFQVNDYNDSPIYEQERVLDWLRRSAPEYVIWNPASSTFDSVPNLVRVPLVYERITQDFTPVAQSSPYEILRRRRDDEPIPFEYWRSNLGASLHLGALPAVTEIPDASSCRPQSPDCGEYAHVRLSSAPSQSTVFTLPFTVGEDRYVATFDTVEGVQEYAIRLDRLWFWSAAHAEGIPVRIERDELADEARVRVVTRAGAGARLY